MLVRLKKVLLLLLKTKNNVDGKNSQQYGTIMSVLILFDTIIGLFAVVLF